MTTEKTLAPRPDALALPTPQEWQTLTQLAEALFKSGLLPPHIKSIQAALAVVVKGRELGIPAMQALGNIVVVNGKPTCNAELMLALTYRDHGDDALHIEETTPDRCTVSYKRRSWAERRSYTFTMADAQRAGLAGSQTWQKYPQALLRARCISAVARMAFPDSIAGMYGYEEMGVAVAVEDDGAVVLDQTALPDERAGVTRQGLSTQTHAAPAATAVLAPGTAPTANGQRRRPPSLGDRREAIGDSGAASLPPTAYRLPPGAEAATLDRVAGEFAAAAGTEQAAQARTVEQAKADLKEACLRVGLPVPLNLRDVNGLALRHGVSAVGSSAGVTARWLDDIRAHLPDVPVGPLDEQHMSETATALGALRATCRAAGRAQPQSLAELNTLAQEAGMGIIASWDSASVGWLEAIGRTVGARREAIGGRNEPAPLSPTADRLAPTPEQALADRIAAAPDEGTLEQLATDVARAHEAGTITDEAAEALLGAVDGRAAELDLYGPLSVGDRREAVGDSGAASLSPTADRLSPGPEEVDALTAG